MQLDPFRRIQSAKEEGMHAAMHQQRGVVEQAGDETETTRGWRGRWNRPSRTRTQELAAMVQAAALKTGVLLRAAMKPGLGAATGLAAAAAAAAGLILAIDLIPLDQAAEGRALRRGHMKEVAVEVGRTGGRGGMENAVTDRVGSASEIGGQVVFSTVMRGIGARRARALVQRGGQRVRRTTFGLNAARSSICCLTMPQCEVGEHLPLVPLRAHSICFLFPSLPSSSFLLLPSPPPSPSSSLPSAFL
jgi:hypothetical protein